MMLATYRQALIEQLRFLPFADLPSTPRRFLPLEDMYVERVLIRWDASQHPQPPPSSSEKPSLVDLVHAPGARILLVGDPGAGKTTCLYHLAYDCAIHQSTAVDLKSESQRAPGLPLFLRHAESTGGEQAQIGWSLLVQHPPLPFDFQPMLKQYLRGSHSAIAAFSRIFEAGDGLVLIDADTMVSPTANASLREGIQRLIDRYPNNRYIVTCRPQMRDALLPLAGFSTYCLPALNEEEVEICIARWYPVLTRGSQLAPHILAERISILQGRMRGDEYLCKLVSNPLALTLYICVCAENGSQPPDCTVILPSLLECMLGRHCDRGDDASPDIAPYTTLDEQIRLLQSLALALQVGQGSNAGLDMALLQSQVESLLGDALQAHGVERQWAMQHIIPYLLTRWQRQGLLIQSGSPAAFRLPWQPLREYLAAHALIAQPAFLTEIQHLRDEPHWRDLLPLAAHELASDSAPALALALPRLLLNSATGAGAVRDILLAAECLVAAANGPEVESTLHDDVRKHLLQILNDRAVPLGDRRQAGLLLGHLGDPRFVGLLPPIARIAAGSYLFGSREGYDDEGPQQRVDVPAFAIAIYPVTHQEFARFLASTRNYPQPHYWYDGRFDNPSQPIVGVTWYDANAYCRWLTVELHKAGLLTPELVVRLPLEVEWEKAAAWDPQRQVKRRYPWGDSWSSWRANTAEGRGTWLTMPVGCYPDGVSAYGVHDLIGNVWEWTANRYASYSGARVPFQEAGSYTLRGLSCVSLPTHARCTYRSRLPASYWRYHLGFRIVLARPLQTFAEEQRVRRQPQRTKQKYRERPKV